MKKLLIFIALVFSMTVCLSGCYPNKEMFEQENADRVTAKGIEMMQVWLDENMPDAKLEECSAFISWTSYDGNRYLTDYSPIEDPFEKGQKAVWRKQKDGSYVLAYSSDHSILRLYDGDILVRIENKNTEKN